MLRARSSPVSSCGRSSGPGASAAVPAPPAGAAHTSGSRRTSTRAPLSTDGTSAATAAVTSTCSASATISARRSQTVRVELGEHVVQDEDRVVAVTAQQVVGGQAQGQGVGPGLAVGGVALDRQGADAEGHFVAVRTDEGEAALHLLVAPTRELLAEGRLDGRLVGHLDGLLPERDRRLVADRGLGARGVLGHRGVGVGQERPEVVGQPGAHPHHLAAEPDQLVVPHGERAGEVLVRRPASVTERALEQGVALLEHPLVVRLHAGQPRRAQDHEVVEEAAPLRRVALDQGEVLRREEHGPHQTDHCRARGSGDLFTRARLDRPGLISTSRTAVRPSLPDHGRAHHGLVRPLLYQRRVGGDPVRAEPRQVVDGLDDLRLALAVAPQERRWTPLESGTSRLS